MFIPTRLISIPGQLNLSRGIQRTAWVSSGIIFKMKPIRVKIRANCGHSVISGDKADISGLEQQTTPE